MSAILPIVIFIIAFVALVFFCSALIENMRFVRSLHQ